MNELERWDTVYVKKWFRLKDKFGGFRQSLVRLTTMVTPFPLLVLVECPIERRGRRA